MTRDELHRKLVEISDDCKDIISVQFYQRGKKQLIVVIYEMQYKSLDNELRCYSSDSIMRVLNFFDTEDRIGIDMSGDNRETGLKELTQ